MPEIRLPLVGTANPRGPDNANSIYFTSQKDQFFQNVIFDLVKNNITQSAKIYATKKRWTQGAANSADGTYTYASELIASEFTSVTWVLAAMAATSGGASRIFAWAPSQTSTMSPMGDITGSAQHMIETIIGGIKVFLITSSDGTGWFVARDSFTTNNTSTNVSSTFTANRTSGSVTLAAVSSFSGLYVGQLLTGAGIASGARIASMNSGAGTLDMTIAATSGAATSTTVTREYVAKIIDADFPSSIIGPFACIGGFNLIMTSDGKVYNSNLNSIVSWTSGDYVSTNFYPDNGRGGVWLVGNRVAAFSSDSTEFFYNAGNPTGSPLSPSTELNFNVGSFSPRTICRLDDDLFFLSSTKSGEAKIYKLSGGKPVEISTAQINLLIAAGFSIATLQAFSFAGKRFLLAGYSSNTFILDLELGIWSNWVPSSSPIRITGVYGVISSNYTSASLLYYIDGLQSGFVYTITLNDSNGQNLGNLVIRTSRIDLNTGNRKTVEYYELDSDVQASGTATLEVSDDDYATWTTIGTFDMTQLAPRIYRGGSFKGGRAHRITHSASTPFRASTLTIKYREGAH